MVTDDWSRADLVVPTPLKSQAEQVLRFIGSLGYSRVILKGDGEPLMRMLLDHPTSQAEAWIPHHGGAQRPS